MNERSSSRTDLLIAMKSFIFVTAGVVCMSSMCYFIPAQLLRDEDAANYEATPRQNLGDYCFKKLSKLRALNIHIYDQYLIDAVIGGIRDENIARTVRAAEHTDANALYAYLNTVGEMPQERKSVHLNSGQFQPSTSSRSGYSNHNKREVNKPSGTRSTCFNCGILGHISFNCRKPRVECTNCKRLGHSKEKCPFPRKKEQQVEVLRSV
ncbi:unnamed protein product [Acanthoscelides obtectus]|uniref:CCHC-type domain-containing protein n=1 Tax=Acanthoscelides obtectus TaxID=200917 RepID=A0A9P0L7J9_ACAOB|nr:unnamed protein product [Acanthoscelides obtectus]CAK1624564.1 ATP-dependent RNA helicase glh-4 [Acanthoscelides obtectus]